MSIVRNLEDNMTELMFLQLLDLVPHHGGHGIRPSADTVMRQPADHPLRF